MVFVATDQELSIASQSSGDDDVVIWVWRYIGNWARHNKNCQFTQAVDQSPCSRRFKEFFHSRIPRDAGEFGKLPLAAHQGQLTIQNSSDQSPRHSVWQGCTAYQNVGVKTNLHRRLAARSALTAWVAIAMISASPKASAVGLGLLSTASSFNALAVRSRAISKASWRETLRLRRSCSRSPNCCSLSSTVRILQIVHPEVN
jgi:hypothetical protein